MTDNILNQMTKEQLERHKEQIRLFEESLKK